MAFIWFENVQVEYKIFKLSIGFFPGGPEAMGQVRIISCRLKIPEYGFFFTDLRDEIEELLEGKR